MQPQYKRQARGTSGGDGLGVVSCLGHDPDEFYNDLLEVGA